MVLRCACASPVGSSVGGRANKKAEEEEKLLKLFQGVSKSQQDTFMQWCEQTLHTLNTANNLDGRPALIMGCCWGGSGHHTHPPPLPCCSASSNVCVLPERSGLPVRGPGLRQGLPGGHA